jgi:hypothetical protein
MPSEEPGEEGTPARPRSPNTVERLRLAPPMAPNGTGRRASALPLRPQRAQGRCAAAAAVPTNVADYAVDVRAWRVPRDGQNMQNRSE